MADTLTPKAISCTNINSTNITVNNLTLTSALNTTNLLTTNCTLSNLLNANQINPGTNNNLISSDISNGIQILNKQGIQIPLSFNGSADSVASESASVIYDKINNKFIMFYTGYNGSSVGTINLAYSNNPDGPWSPGGTTFTGSGHTFDAGGVTNPAIYIENGVYYLFYTGLASIGYNFYGTIGLVTTSTFVLNGSTTWSGNQIVNTVGSTWMSSGLGRATIIKRNNVYFLFFSASNGSTEAIGFATSNTINGIYTLSGSNPVFSPIGSSSDTGGCSSPQVYDNGFQMVMVYGMNDGVTIGSGIWRQSYAITN